MSTTNNYQWVKVTDHAEFPPRDGVGALVYHDELYIIGGWNPIDKQYYPRDCVNDVWRSKNGANWERIKDNDYTRDKAPEQWEGTHTAGYVVYQDKMWIVGGDPLQGHYQSEVWNSSDGIDWHHVNEGHPVPWAPRVLHYTFVLNDKLYVLGGQTLPQFAPAPELFYHDIWCTEDGIHWEEIEMKTPYTPQRGLICGNAVFKDRVWLIGGGGYETDNRPYVYNNDVWSSDDCTNWTCHTANAPWTGKLYHNVIVFDEKLWIIGGQSSTENTNDVWYSSDCKDWTEVPDSPWAKRHATALFDFDDKLWLMTGNHLDNDIYYLKKD